MTKQRKPVDDKQERQASSEQCDPREGLATDDELANATNLSEIMDLIGKRAQARGLTPEKLYEILAETRKA